MADNKNLKAAIADVIKANGAHEITGTILQEVLFSMIDQIGGANFAGLATPNTNPGLPDTNVFYIASTPGTYTYFGNVELTKKALVFYNVTSGWAAVETNIPLQSEVQNADLINRGIFMPDSDLTELNRGVILNLGAVSGLVADKQYYLNIIRSANALLQVTDESGNVVSQYYSASAASGIEDVLLLNYDDNTEIFRAMVNWDAVGEVTTFGKKLHINRNNYYADYEADINKINTEIGEITNEVNMLQSDIENLTDVELATNQLFDPGSVTNAYVRAADGQVIADNYAKITDYIYCEGKSSIYTYTNWNHLLPCYVAFYDAEKNYISNAIFVRDGYMCQIAQIPSNAVYFRGTVRSTNVNELYNPDNVFISFVPYRGDKRYLPVVDKIEDKQINYLPKLSTGMNLFNGSWVSGLINTSGTGVYTVDSQNRGAVSDFIYCKGQKKGYTYIPRQNGWGLYAGFYNEDKEPIGGALATLVNGTSGNYDIPAGAVYMRQAISALNETRTDMTGTYIGFYPYPGSTANDVLQYGTDKIRFAPGKVDRPPVDADDPVNLAALREYIGAEPSIQNQIYVALGDSITAPSNSYADKLATIFGMRLTNLGVSGCHFTNYEDTVVDFSARPIHSELPNENSTNVIQNQVYRLLQMITPTDTVVPEITEETEFYAGYSYPVMGTGVLNAEDINLVTIACGTNDAGGLRPMGSLSDVNLVNYKDLTRDTYWSAMKWAINVIRLYLPNARIVMISPIQRRLSRAQQWPYVQAQLDAANQFACPCVNMFQESGIMSEIEQVENRYLSDGLHPNQAGHTLMAKIIASKLLEWYKY